MTKAKHFQGFMQYAVQQAKIAIKRNELPIGAIIVNRDTNNVISKAHNQTIQKKSLIEHAELIAIKKIKKHHIGSDDYDLSNCDLYTTLEPCPMCLHAIILSRIKNIYVGAKNPIHSSYYEVNREFIIRSKVNIYYGFLEEECSKLLKNFFIDLRNS